MYYGINKHGVKVPIEHSEAGSEYTCPVCSGLLIRKCGQIRTHHFAHKTALCDTWYHENKGEWHRKWQSQFSDECCEVRIDGENGEFHIADVFIKGEKKG